VQHDDGAAMNWSAIEIAAELVAFALLVNVGASAVSAGAACTMNSGTIVKERGALLIVCEPRPPFNFDAWRVG
jgi:hypothetical protein